MEDANYDQDCERPKYLEKSEYNNDPLFPHEEQQLDRTVHILGKLSCHMQVIYYWLVLQGPLFQCTVISSLQPDQTLLEGVT